MWIHISIKIFGARDTIHQCLHLKYCAAAAGDGQEDRERAKDTLGERETESIDRERANAIYVCRCNDISV